MYMLVNLSIYLWYCFIYLLSVCFCVHRFVIGLLVTLAGILLCVMLPAPGRTYTTMIVPNTDVAKWSTSVDGSILAKGYCATHGASGGAVHNMTYIFSTDDEKGLFKLSCQDARLSRKAYVTIAVTVVALLAMNHDG